MESGPLIVPHSAHDNADDATEETECTGNTCGESDHVTDGVAAKADSPVSC